jgi:hypothetical protein
MGFRFLAMAGIFLCLGCCKSTVVSSPARDSTGDAVEKGNYTLVMITLPLPSQSERALRKAQNDKWLTEARLSGSEQMDINSNINGNWYYVGRADGVPNTGLPSQAKKLIASSAGIFMDIQAILGDSPVKQKQVGLAEGPNRWLEINQSVLIGLTRLMKDHAMLFTEIYPNANNAMGSSLGQISIVQGKNGLFQLQGGFAGERDVAAGNIDDPSSYGAAISRPLSDSKEQILNPLATASVLRVEACICSGTGELNGTLLRIGWTLPQSSLCLLDSQMKILRFASEFFGAAEPGYSFEKKK